MATPALPPHVVSGELITSAWGNAVAIVLEQTDLLMSGPTPGASIGPGGQTQVAYVDLPPGSWMVWWQCLISSSNSLSAACRLFFGGVSYTDAYYNLPVVGANAQITAQVMGWVNAPGGTRASVNVINSGAAAINTYADPGNHRMFAMGGRV